MRIIILSLFMLLSLLSNGQDIRDTLKRSAELYDEGIKYFNENEYMIADSLFEQSLRLYPHPDTYFNRAVTRKNLGDEAGFAKNLERAMEYGDTTARKLYHKHCVVADTFYITQDNKKASLFDFHRCIIFRKSKYTSYQEVQRYTPGGIIDLQYMVQNKDTVYVIIPSDEVTMNYASFFNTQVAPKLKYPAELRDKGVEGTVLLSFTVEKDGSLTDIVIVRSNAMAFSAAIITAFTTAGKFPAVHYEGKSVKVKMSMPVRFSIRG